MSQLRAISLESFHYVRSVQNHVQYLCFQREDLLRDVNLLLFKKFKEIYFVKEFGDANYFFKFEKRSSISIYEK